MIYNQLRNTNDFKQLMEEMYFSKDDQVQELQLPPMKYLSYSGRGAPGSAGFQTAIKSLYGVAYTLKTGLKFGKLAQPQNYYDYKVPPLEGLWWQAGQVDQSQPEKWHWRLLMLQPAFISEAMVNEAQFLAKRKHPDIPYYHVRLERFDEGRVIQLLHVGPYDKERPTLDKLIEYAERHGYEIAGEHHEIYMSDPRRVKPERLKTVLRYEVKKKGANK